MNYITNIPSKGGSACLTFLLLLFLVPLSAQDLNDDGLPHRINDVEYVDYNIPTGIEGELIFTLNGGDGGRRVVPNLCIKNGGEGATARLIFAVGDGPNKLEPGGTIRFVIGEKGQSLKNNGTTAGGGGGGTAVLYKAPGASISCSDEIPSLNLSNANSCWVILGVAGGGGGAYASGLCDGAAGQGGRSGTSGGDGAGPSGGTGGTGGHGGFKGSGSGGGGGYLSRGTANGEGEGEAGYFTGGEGGYLGNASEGAFGYGGGGGRGSFAGGGGGGFSGGGGGGAYNRGGGGGSFANSAAIFSEIEGGGSTRRPRNGYVDYQFRDITITKPIAVCQDVTVEIDATGMGTVTLQDVDGGSYHPLGEAFDLCFFVFAPPFYVGCGGDIATFDCSDNDKELTLILAAYEPQPDGSTGDGSSCFVTVSVEDNLAPTALCQQGLQLVPGLEGEVSITPADINHGSYDNCGVTAYALSKTTFTCDEIGTHTVTLTAADASDNFGTCTTTIEIIDYIRDCPADYCITLPSGQSEMYLDLSEPPGTFTCGYSLKSRICRTDGVGLDCTPSSGFDTQDKSGFYSAGEYSMIWQVKNGGGVIVDFCRTRITIAPSEQDFVYTCGPDITIQIPDGACEVQVDLPDLPVIPPCGYEFTSKVCTMTSCNPPSGWNPDNKSGMYPPGDYRLIWRLTLDGVSQGLCTSKILVEESAPIEAACSDVTVQLGSSGSTPLTIEQVDNNSSGACAIASMTLSQTAFDCSDVGANMETLTVTDANGNTATCSAIITVEDNVAPQANCKNVSVELDANGSATLTIEQVDNNSSDACGIPIAIGNMTLSQTTFDCSDVGTNTETLTVTDVNGNVSTCTATITVAEDIDPVAACQDITIQLNENGNASITGLQVDNGSSDVCGISSRTLDNDAFDCSQAGGASLVTLTVTDNNGNTNTCSAQVTVQDNTPPNAKCRNRTFNLNENGQYSITYQEINNFSTDACGIQSHEINIFTFDCNDLGSNAVTLTITDNNGNVSSCTANVNIRDQIAPDLVCPEHYTFQLDEFGEAIVDLEAYTSGSSDNCGITVWEAQFTDYDCDYVGDNFMVLTVYDEAGNSAFCFKPITIEDNVAPQALCQNVTVELDANGSAVLTIEQVDNNSSDACGIASLALSQSSFNCSDVGINTESLTVTDANGNTATCSASITVEDNIVPQVLCKNVTVQLDNNGSAALTAEQVDNNSSDVCGFANLALSQSTFDCSEVGTHTETLTVTDMNGNASTCSATISVEDNVVPTALCQNVTIEVDANGLAALTIEQVDNSSSDACGIANLALSQTTFDCSNVGFNAETLTVTDANGNASTCSATIAVEDNLSPTISCLNPTYDFNGVSSLDIEIADIWDEVNSSDNCGEVYYLEQSALEITCGQLGTHIPVTLTMEDASGNTATCTAMVTLTGFPCGWMIDPAGVGCDAGQGNFSLPDVFTLSSEGCYDPAYYRSNDQQGFIQHELCGDGEIMAQVTDVTGGGWAGIAVRESNAPGARMIQLMIDGQSLTRREARVSPNAPAYAHSFQTQGRNWLRISRVGNQFTASHSLDGINWQIVFSTYLPLSDCLDFGLITMNGHAAGMVTGTFEHVTVTGSSGNSLNTKPGVVEFEIERSPLPELNIAPSLFTTHTRITLTMPEAKIARVDIFNLQGQLVHQLHKGYLDAGNHFRQWDGSDQQGRLLPSGMYWVRFQTGTQQVSKKIILQRR